MVCIDTAVLDTQTSLAYDGALPNGAIKPLTPDDETVQLLGL